MPCLRAFKIASETEILTMNHKQIVATYSDITLEGIIRDLAKITHYGPTHYGPTRDWADKRLAAARAELRKRETEYNKILK